MTFQNLCCFPFLIRSRKKVNSLTPEDSPAHQIPDQEVPPTKHENLQSSSPTISSRRSSIVSFLGVSPTVAAAVVLPASNTHFNREDPRTSVADQWITPIFTISPKNPWQSCTNVASSKSTKISLAQVCIESAMFFMHSRNLSFSGRKITARFGPNGLKTDQ